MPTTLVPNKTRERAKSGVNSQLFANGDPTVTKMIKR